MIFRFLLIVSLLSFGCGGAPEPAPKAAAKAAPEEDLGPRPGNPMPTPRIHAVEPQEGFNDEPALAMTDAEDVFVGWISFRDGADSLQIARYRHNEDWFEKQQDWQAAGGRGSYLLGLQAVTAGEQVYFVYSSESGGDWDVYAVAASAKGVGRPVKIASGAEAQGKPSAAWHDGALWVAWEANKDSLRQVYLASLRDGKVSAPELVSAEARSNYEPSVAVATNGLVSVAWHSFRDDNYDVYLRQRSPAGEWTETRRLTQAPGIDRHASVFTHGDDLWLLYEHALMEEYFIGRTNERHIVVAKVTARGLEAPPDYLNTSPLAKDRSEAASAAFDSQGRLWVAYQQPREPRGGWAAQLVCYTGAEWVAKRPLSQRRSMDRPAPILLKGNRLLLAFQADDFSDSWSQSDPDYTTTAHSKILLASVDTGQAPAAASSMQLAALVEPDHEFEAGRLRNEFGEDAETPSIEYNGETLYLYYGDLHEHSDVSICNRCGDQSLDENYQCRRDLNRLDFAAMTDHGYNIVPYLWNYSAKLVRFNNDPGRLVTFLAEEWTSSFEDYDEKRPWGYYGHRNIIFADPYFPRWWIAENGDTPTKLWAELRGMKADFVQIPHQLADTGNVPTDWDYTDEVAQPVAEIYQTRGSYEYPGAPRHARNATGVRGNYIQDAWARGIKIGVIASPDHGGGVGKACVWAKEKSRKAILEAIRERRSFGTTASRMVIDFRVNGRLMGEAIEAGEGPVKITATVRCPTKIAKVEICRDNEFIYATEPGGKEASVEFVDQQPASGPSFYYLRVIQENEEIGWSSPVWMGGD